MKIIILKATAEEIRSNRTIGEMLTNILYKTFSSICGEEEDGEDDDRDEEKEEACD